MKGSSTARSWTDSGCKVLRHPRHLVGEVVRLNDLVAGLIGRRVHLLQLLELLNGIGIIGGIKDCPLRMCRRHEQRGNRQNETAKPS